VNSISDIFMTRKSKAKHVSFYLTPKTLSIIKIVNLTFPFRW